MLSGQHVLHVVRFTLPAGGTLPDVTALRAGAALAASGGNSGHFCPVDITTE